MKRAIAFSGLVVGTLDGLDAVILTWVYGGSPLRMFQGIGAGLIGREAALSGGAPTVILGILCHFFIATVVSAIYIAAGRKLPLLTAHPLICGALYGLVVLAVMRNVVIPLSALGPPARALAGVGLINQLFAHICLVGIPAALVARAAR
jgi:uncharacterized membrane protein YagU involved in acid resistance